MSAETQSNPGQLKDFDASSDEKGKDSEAKPGSPTAKAEGAKKPEAAPAGDSQGKPIKTAEEAKAEVKKPEDPKKVAERQATANSGEQEKPLPEGKKTPPPADENPDPKAPEKKAEDNTEPEAKKKAELPEAAKKVLAANEKAGAEAKPKVATMPPRVVSKSEAIRLLTMKQLDRAERIILIHAPGGPLWKGLVLAMRKDPKDWAEKSHKGWQEGVRAALRAERFLDAESRSGRLEDICPSIIEHCARNWEASQPKF